MSHCLSYLYFLLVIIYIYIQNQLFFLLLRELCLVLKCCCNRMLLKYITRLLKFTSFCLFFSFNSKKREDVKETNNKKEQKKSKRKSFYVRSFCQFNVSWYIRKIIWLLTVLRMVCVLWVHVYPIYKYAPIYTCETISTIDRSNHSNFKIFYQL